MKYILIYGFESINPKKRLGFNRRLYGFSDSSNFGSYSYFRRGVFEPKSYKKLAKGVVLFSKMPKELIKHLKENKATYYIFKVVA